MKSTFRKLAVVTIVFLSATPALAQRGGRFGLTSGYLADRSDLKSAFKTLVADADGCTVRVLCEGKEKVLGTVVGPDGWIVTKYSELSEPIACRLSDGRQTPAKVVGYDREFDLAMLKVDAKGLKSVEWSEDESGPAVGQLVATAQPGDLPQAVGVVSVPRRAIPSKARALLGVGLDEVKDIVTIKEITKDSAADKAGFQVGDVVLRIDDKLVSSRDKMIELIRQHVPGDRVTVAVHRGTEDLNLTATLGKPQTGFGPTRSDRMNQMGSKLSDLASGFSSVIQHDTVLQSSQCGGPLVDLSGKVVGINIARAGRTESYAAPADRVKALLSDLENGKLPPKTMLAGATQTKPDDKAEQKPAEAKAEK